MADDVQVDLEVDKGSDYAVQLYWTDQYDSPIAISHPMKMTVAFATPFTYISTSEVPSGPQASYLSYNSSIGFVQLSLPDSYTNNLIPGIYQYDLWAQVLDPDDINNTTKRTKIFGGSFVVVGAITTF